MPVGECSVKGSRFIGFDGGSIPCFLEMLGQNRDHRLTFHSLFNCETNEMLNVCFHFFVLCLGNFEFT